MTVRQNFVIDDELTRIAEASDHIRDSERPRAVFAGRLAAIKAPSIALLAIAQSEEWQLDVVGSGPEEGSLRELAQELGITERVEFVPWLPRQDLWRRMATADALLVPSLRDEGPMIIAEAYALGLPVIAFDQGGAAVLAGQDDAAVTLVPLESMGEGAAAFAASLSFLPHRLEPGKDFTVDRIGDYLTALYRRCSDEAPTG
jgi:D-inositol-3-phosphate glycosyltransferase